MPTTPSTSSIWRRDVMAWCCYDWANSGYTTLMITVFAVYMQRTVFNSESSGTTGAVVWAWSVAVSMLIGAILSPLVGAIADARAGKRFGLGLTAMCGGSACMLMAIVPPDLTWQIVACLVVANVCLELSLTFYNGFLPEITNDEELNRVSAAGMALGYLGGGLALLFAMLSLNLGERIGIANGETALRVCIFATGFWWSVFTLPTILVLRDHPQPVAKAKLRSTGRRALGDVVDTLKSLRHHRTLLLFLVAFLFYNDGLQTVISQASTFAIQELKFTDRELVAVVLMVQFIATPGAILIGWISDRLGRKQTLVICLTVWILLLALAWFVNSKTGYWILSIGVALVLGGTQSVSRAIMGSLTPKEQGARYFGFFNLSGKATGFLGTFVFGLIIAITGSSRIAIVGLLAFFLIGLSLIFRIRFKSNTS